MGDISKNFNRSEFACKCGCGFDTVDSETLKVLEFVREHFKKPVTITSGCRCESYNKRIGGADMSQHRLGRAADIVVKDTAAVDVYRAIDEKFGNCYGFGSYPNFTHVDTRSSKARW